MTAEIVTLGIPTTAPAHADKILEAAKGKLEECFIIGTTLGGEEWFSGNRSEAMTILFHIERAKYNLMKMIDDA
jgi:hypothetical protein